MPNVPRTAEQRAADREKARIASRIAYRRAQIRTLEFEIEEIEKLARGACDSTPQNGTSEATP
jgi:hypothetical protein